MQAWQIDEFGPANSLMLREVPDPVPGPGEVLVTVEAASVNPADAKLRAGRSPGADAIRFPLTLGRDFSGTVAKLGEGVTDVAVGDAVFGVLDRGHEGACAGKVALSAGLVARKPEALSHVEAAALALTGLTALVALEDVAQLARGQRILIHGGAGGVGSFAVQYARHVGAEVFVTASARNHDYLRDLGADSVIDYTATSFEEAVADCDVVFDTIGGEVHRRSLKVLKPGGLLVHIAPGPADMATPETNRIVRPHVGRDRAHLTRILDLVASGAVRPPEIATMAFTDLPAAHEQIETGHVRGKIVLSPVS